MRTKLAAVVSVFAASLAASACSDQPSSSPTAPLARLPRATSASLTPLACEINILKADARDFAASGNDALFKIITDLGKLTPGSAEATDKAFDGLGRMAAIRGTSDQRPNASGATFDRLVHRFLGCADPAVVADAREQYFGDALGLGWMFEVRGKSTGPYADPPGGAYERGSKTENWWAAEVSGSWADAITSSSLADRVLIYGFETNYLDIGGRFGGSSFDNSTIPGIAAGKFGLSVNIGLCVPTATISPTARLNHNYKFVALVNTLTCSTPTDFTATTGTLSLAAMNPVRLAKQAFGFFMPQPAYAAFAAGSVGGAVSELSPSAIYDLSNVSLWYNGLIADNFVNVELKTTDTPSQKVKVRATNAANGNGDPIPGLTIQLSIAGNSSSIAFFNDNGTKKVTVIRTTGTDGWATFDGVSLTKAGGYQLAAQVYFDNVAGPLLPSNSFNIQNKSSP